MPSSDIFTAHLPAIVLLSITRMRMLIENILYQLIGSLLSDLSAIVPFNARFASMAQLCSCRFRFRLVNSAQCERARARKYLYGRVLLDLHGK
jgi:hypothetical protein